MLGDTASRQKFIATVPRVGYRFIAAVEPVWPAPLTLAVLPFENLSHDAAEDFLADGVADALTTELGSVSTLRVISRQSVLRFKDSRKPLPEIAAELNADALVEGSVLQHAGRLRITAQLVQAAPEQHLWAKAYECGMGDILSVQGEVAQAVAHAVQAALTPAEISRLRRASPADPEAHISYLKGLHHMARWSRESFERALAHFRDAVARDPSHAPAYANMADCYAMLGHWGHHPFLDAFQKAKDAALKALALDDSLSTAHWAFGWATWVCDWDVKTCEAEFLRAIQLNPSEEHAHAAYSIFLVTMTNERARAVSEMRTALDLSQYMNALMGWIHLFVRDFDAACEQAQRALELFPDALQAWWVLGLAESCRCRRRQAVTALQQAAAISPDPLSLAYLGYALATAGDLDAARSVLENLLSRSEREPVPPRCFAFLHAALGEYDRAFEWLEKAREAHDSGIFWLRAMPVYDPLRPDPRFAGMLRRIGLPVETRSDSAAGCSSKL